MEDEIIIVRIIDHLDASLKRQVTFMIIRLQVVCIALILDTLKRYTKSDELSL